MFFQLPMTIILAGVLQRRFRKFLKKYQESPSTQQADTVLQALNKNLAFGALLIAELLLAIFYLIQNGFVAFLIAPMRVWGVVLLVFLFYQAHWRVTDQHFKQSSLICSPDNKLATS